MPNKKVRSKKFRLVKLVTDIRYRFEKGGRVYLIGETFELPIKQAKAEEIAGRVVEVVSGTDESE